MESTSGANALKGMLWRTELLHEGLKLMPLFLIRMVFLRQARAGLATGGCTLELVFVIFSAQLKGISNESPANYQQESFVRIKTFSPSIPLSPNVTISRTRS